MSHHRGASSPAPQAGGGGRSDAEVDRARAQQRPLHSAKADAEEQRTVHPHAVPAADAGHAGAVRSASAQRTAADATDGRGSGADGAAAHLLILLPLLLLSLSVRRCGCRCGDRVRHFHLRPPRVAGCIAEEHGGRCGLIEEAEAGSGACATGT